MRRFKNYGLWVSSFALVGILFKDKLPTEFDTIVSILLGILVEVGIVSNPKNGSWYTDKKS